MRALLLVLLLSGALWADEFKRYGEWAGGMATLSIGIEQGSSRRGLARFAMSGRDPVELRFSAAQWQEVARAVRAAIRCEVADGESGEVTEVAGLRVRAVGPMAGRPRGVQMAAGDDATIVVHDFGALQGAVNDVSAALRTER